MPEIIGIRYKNVGKIYHFDSCGIKYKKGTKVILDTTYGIAVGDVVIENKFIEDEQVIHPLRKALRPANAQDFAQLELINKRKQEVFDIWPAKTAEHNLKMKLIDVEVTFDNSKTTCNFIAEGRVDFRNLAKDLAFVFRTRIELHQIQVRDEAKAIGGLGVCGKVFCCSSFLVDFQPISIKMAKEQGLALSPTKISGTCGKLMCCLKYEHENYEELLRITPKVDALVETPAGTGVVVEVNILEGILKVRMNNAPEAAPKQFQRSELKIIRDSELKIDKKELESLTGLE